MTIAHHEQDATGKATEDTDMTMVVAEEAIPPTEREPTPAPVTNVEPTQ